MCVRVCVRVCECVCVYVCVRGGGGGVNIKHPKLTNQRKAAYGHFALAGVRAPLIKLTTWLCLHTSDFIALVRSTDSTIKCYTEWGKSKVDFEV